MSAPSLCLAPAYRTPDPRDLPPELAAAMLSLVDVQHGPLPPAVAARLAGHGCVVSRGDWYALTDAGADALAGWLDDDEVEALRTIRDHRRQPERSGRLVALGLAAKAGLWDVTDRGGLLLAFLDERGGR